VFRNKYTIAFNDGTTWKFSMPLFSVMFSGKSSYTSNPLAVFGSRTFTDRSNNADGYFEVTYRVEQVFVATQFSIP
jgi:hypothetical protein